MKYMSFFLDKTLQMAIFAPQKIEIWKTTS